MHTQFYRKSNLKTSSIPIPSRQPRVTDSSVGGLFQSTTSFNRLRPNQEEAIRQISCLQLKLKCMESQFRTFKAQILKQIKLIKNYLQQHNIHESSSYPILNYQTKNQLYQPKQSHNQEQFSCVDDQTPSSPILRLQEIPTKVQHCHNNMLSGQRFKTVIKDLTGRINMVKRANEEKEMQEVVTKHENFNFDDGEIKMERSRIKRPNNLECYIQDYLDEKITFQKLKRILKINAEKAQQRIQKYKQQYGYSDRYIF